MTILTKISVEKRAIKEEEKPKCKPERPNC